MKRDSHEHTLFRPDPKFSVAPAVGARKPVGGARATAADDGEPEVTLKDRISEAMRSAGRRPVLTAFVVIVCAALTVFAAIYVPRTYEVEARILVARTTALEGESQYQPTTEEKKNAAKEFEQQILARDNILAIIKQTDLVERWDTMRQPYRRLLDRANEKLGRPAPDDEAKLDMLVKTIEGKLSVGVDGTTVSIHLDWGEPVSARDIVEAAVKNFIANRYAIEVGVIPEALRILEASLASAKGSLVAALQELNARQPTIRQGGRLITITQTPPPPGVDPALVRKLDETRAAMEPLKNEKAQRMAQLNNQLAEMQQTLAPGHPQVIALKAQMAAVDADSPQLAALKENEKSLLAQIEAQKANQAVPPAERKTIMAPGPAVTAEPIGTPRSLADLQGQVDMLQRQYEAALLKTQTARIQMQTAEAAFKHRYSVVHPAEVPGGPKKPVTLIAAMIGALLTMVFALAVASFRDRLSGIFFEPRDVRDRLGLPVFATLK